MFEIGRHGLAYSGYGYGWNHHRQRVLTQDEIQFPGLTKTEIRKRKNEMLLGSIINKTGRRSGQKVRRSNDSGGDDMSAKVVQFPGTKANVPVEPQVKSISIFEYFEMARVNGLFFKNTVNEADFTPPEGMLA